MIGSLFESNGIDVNLILPFIIEIGLLSITERKNEDLQTINTIYIKINNLNELISNVIHTNENKQKLIELQRELIGADNLVPVSYRLNRVSASHHCPLTVTKYNLKSLSISLFSFHFS